MPLHSECVVLCDLDVIGKSVSGLVPWRAELASFVIAPVSVILHQTCKFYIYQVRQVGPGLGQSPQHRARYIQHDK